jgi:hypothetical protein
MFFYVDESGHTGSELFDANQPVLNRPGFRGGSNL